MGNQKQKWTSEEEEALKAGVAKHGTGKWKNILTDPHFAPFLTQRSNIDLKDKWRNLGISTGLQGSKDRDKFSSLTITYGPISSAQNSNSAASLAGNDVTCDSSRIPADGITAQRYYPWIFEALSTIKDSRGSDLGAIARFIEQRNDVPQNFRRSLSSMVRRLILQGKLEKVQKRYKIKDSVSGTKTPSPKQKDVKPRPSPNSGFVIPSTREGAVRTTAYRIADAENKSFVASEAVKEAERVSNMAEETESMLQIVKGIYEQCSGDKFFVCDCDTGHP